MNRFGMALGAGVVGIALIAGCSGDSADDDLTSTPTATATSEPTSSATSSPTTDPTATATPETVEDSIKDGLIMDQEIAAGTTMSWTNDDDAARTITSDDGTVDSGEIAPGDSFEFTFEDAGSWKLMVDGVESATITVS
jgi:nitrite reductase (NO-forming)